MTELEPPREPEPFPPMTTRDKLVLVATFVIALAAVAGVVVAWDDMPFIARPTP